MKSLNVVVPFPRERFMVTDHRRRAVRYFTDVKGNQRLWGPGGRLVAGTDVGLELENGVHQPQGDGVVACASPRGASA